MANGTLFSLFAEKQKGEFLYRRKDLTEILKFNLAFCMYIPKAVGSS